MLYVEDSRVVATATKRMLERQAMQVLHVISAEDALEHLHEYIGRSDGDVGIDLVLTDVYLKGELSGHDLLERGARRLRLRQAPPAGAGDDRRRQSATTRPRCCARAPTTWC